MPKVSRRDLTWYMQNPTTVRVPSYRVLYWIFQTTRGTRARSFQSRGWSVYLKFQIPQPCIFRSHLQSRPDTGSAAYTDPIQARQGQFTVIQGFCIILVFGFMASTSVLLFLSPILLRDLSNVLFPVINCLFRTAENKWSAWRCSLWKGKIKSLERLH